MRPRPFGCAGSQKPLLLDYALQFEQLATNPRAHSTSDKGSNGKMITWSDPNQLEAYVQQLHATAERLTQENRKLRQVHTSIGEQVRARASGRVRRP